jgi:hypothetical protein
MLRCYGSNCHNVFCICLQEKLLLCLDAAKQENGALTVSIQTQQKTAAETKVGQLPNPLLRTASVCDWEN